MEPSLIIRLGIAASILAHLVVAAAIFLSTDVRTFEQAAPEPVAVDIVDPDQPEKTPEPVPSPSPKPDLTLPEKSAPSSPSSSSSAAPSQPPQAPQPPPASREAATQPQPQPQPQSQPQAQSQPQPRPQQPAPSPTPAQSQGYIPAEPDVTVKYGVMLGLPQALPPLAPSADKSDDKDAGPSASANLAANLTTAFRRHLRSCSKLPGSVAASDTVMVKLRVFMTPEGKVAAEPALIEGTASVKALDLKQSAVSALMACQPYTMLPPERYGEWKVLELSFTPQDFGS